tara:strand:- start:605 stop:931 length:327 start_codon:yes stop_codon:yes gene_type:complete
MNNITPFIKDMASNEIKKSASYQFISELTQLTVDDIKSTNNLLSDLGTNFNEIAQSGVDYMEDDEYRQIFSPKTFVLRSIIRLLIGEVVHFIHYVITFIIYHIQHFHL